jgi:hypothetical protein
MKKKMKGDVYARNGPGAIRWILRWLSREIACRVLPSPICPWSKTRKIQSHELIWLEKETHYPNVGRSSRPSRRSNIWHMNNV